MSPAIPTSHVRITSHLVTLVAPVFECRKVRDRVLETLMITSWVTSETGCLGTDTFLNIAREKGRHPVRHQSHLLTRPHGLWYAGLLCPWNSPGKNTGVGSHSLLQGIFPIQGSNPGLPHCRQILYHLSCQGSPCLSDCSSSEPERKSRWRLRQTPRIDEFPAESGIFPDHLRTQGHNQN